jgi:hypothetical protein
MALSKNPDELAAEVGELLARAARIRYDFLRTELQLCTITLQMGDYELTLGNMHAVRKEIQAAGKGIDVLEKLLPAASAQERSELEPQLAELKNLLQTLNTNFMAMSGKTGNDSGPALVRSGNQ